MALTKVESDASDKLSCVLRTGRYQLSEESSALQELKRERERQAIRRGKKENKESDEQEEETRGLLCNDAGVSYFNHNECQRSACREH